MHRKQWATRECVIICIICLLNFRTSLELCVLAKCFQCVLLFLHMSDIVVTVIVLHVVEKVKCSLNICKNIHIFSAAIM